MSSISPPQPVGVLSHFPRSYGALSDGRPCCLPWKCLETPLLWQELSTQKLAVAEGRARFPAFRFAPVL